MGPLELLKSRSYVGLLVLGAVVGIVVAAAAYFFLKGARLHPLAEVKYRYLKWKINHVRKKFDVYSGGRANDFDRRVH